MDRREMEYSGPELDHLRGEDANGRPFIVRGMALDDRAAEMAEDGTITLSAARAELMDAREWEPGVHSGCDYADNDDND